MQETRTNRNTTTRHARRQGRQYRGNTIVLVAGILVLLVIIATSYLTRTQSQRTVSVATSEWHNIDAVAGVIAENVAEELALQIFVRPIDPEIYADLVGEYGVEGAQIRIRNANLPRLHPSMYSQVHAHGYRDPGTNTCVREAEIAPGRYNVDHSTYAACLQRSFSFNFAPYHTVPWTNWPDPDSLNPGDPPFQLWPAGPGNPVPFAGKAGGFGAAAQAALASEYNPLGNPGFGDNRLLADIEPLRWIIPGGVLGGAEAFSHWRKLTNLAHANNAWRVIADIRDVDANIVSDLNRPIEQWTMRTPTWQGATPLAPGSPYTFPLSALSGNVNYNVLIAQNRFRDQWEAWFFGNDLEYANAMLGGKPGIPPNLYKLNDLNATNVSHNYKAGNPLVPQDRPQDEFVFGTARNEVTRRLADTTGDGFTDAFWFTAPVPPRNGIRTIAAVRIIDNNAMINANTATRFQRNDSDNTFPSSTEARKTRGQKPTDIALVGELDGDNEQSLNPDDWAKTWNVGFYDHHPNWFSPSSGAKPFIHGYNRYRWNRHLTSIGLPNSGNPDTIPGLQLLTEQDRRDYWRLSGRHGLRYSPDSNYTPFNLSDEIELRAFHGNNHPWIFTRYEQSVQNSDSGCTPGADDQWQRFLLAGTGCEGTSEYLEQLTNVRLVQSNRRHLTLYNGVRNDLLPPWLSWEERRSQMPTLIENYLDRWDNLDDWAVDLIEGRALHQGRQKIDLREMNDRYYPPVGSGPGDFSPTGNNWPDYYDAVADAGRLNFRDRLADTLLLALTDSDRQGLQGNHIYGSYFGPFARVNLTQEWNPIDETYDALGGDLSFTNANSALNKSRRMAAAWASNIIGYRSNKPASLDQSRVELPRFEGLGQGRITTGGTNTAYLPIDPQPFIVEVFIGHVYKSSDSRPPYHHPSPPDDDCGDIDPNDPDTVPYANLGSRLIFDRGEDDPHRSTIVVVQIANPFDVPIDLREYRLAVLGNDANANRVNLEAFFEETGIPDYILPPARDDLPTTAIFYAMRSDGDWNDVAAKWREFLDINLSAGDDRLPPGTLVFNITDRLTVNSRNPYDNPGQRRTVSIDRSDRSLDAMEPVWMTVDRIDPARPDERAFRDTVRDMGDYRPMTYPGPDLCTVVPDPGPDPGIGDASYPYANAFPTYHVRDNDHHWVQWVRATRAWGVDLNGNGAYEAHERNPRFVFGDRAVVVPTWHGTPDADNQDGSGRPARFWRPRSTNVNPNTPPDLVDMHNDAAGGNAYRFADDPNDSPAASLKPWFARTYYNSYGDLVDGDTPSSGRTPGIDGGNPIPQRKPTFFALGWDEGQWEGVDWDDDSRAYFMPEKGWYGQFKINLREDPTTATFKTEGVGWGRPGVDPNVPEAEPPTSGVDDPTILFPNMPLWNGSTLAWNGQVLPLFRQPFSMQMTLKNKHISVDYTYQSPVNAFEVERNRDFEQVGELLNVWLFGHEISYTLTGGQINPASVTVDTTFAEHMSRARRTGTGAQYLWTLTGGTPDFVQMLAAGPDDPNPYQRFLNWLADPDKNRVNRARLRPWEFREVVSPTGPVIRNVYFGDIIGRTRTARQELYLSDSRHAVPALPAAVRVLDAFVCDGPGSVWYDRGADQWFEELPDGEQIPLSFEDVERRRFYNANAFAGKSTPGLININTAPLEVLRTMPHMTRMVHENPNWSLADNPFPEFGRALIRYRERFGDPTTFESNNDVPYTATPDPFNLNHGPAYAHRGRDRDWFRPGVDNVTALLKSMRGDRGMASIGELKLLTQSGRIGKRADDVNLRPDERFYDNPPNAGQAFTAIDFNSSWRIDYGGFPERNVFHVDRPENSPFEAYLFGTTNTGDLPPDADASLTRVSTSARISTDVVEEFDDRQGSNVTPGYPAGLHPDLVAEDAQESNLLFAGLSNLVTTRSDVFTVYLRIRSFRQNPITGKWDATDPDYIVDDSRYVMLVDRSNVNKPTDKPKILYLEKLPK